MWMYVKFVRCFSLLWLLNGAKSFEVSFSHLIMKLLLSSLTISLQSLFLERDGAFFLGEDIIRGQSTSRKWYQVIRIRKRIYPAGFNQLQKAHMSFSSLLINLEDWRQDDSSLEFLASPFFGGSECKYCILIWWNVAAGEWPPKRFWPHAKWTLLSSDWLFQAIQ